VDGANLDRRKSRRPSCVPGAGEVPKNGCQCISITLPFPRCLLAVRAHEISSYDDFIERSACQTRPAAGRTAALPFLLRRRAATNPVSTRQKKSWRAPSWQPPGFEFLAGVHSIGGMLHLLVDELIWLA
jgi:hypothetical protein